MVESLVWGDGLSYIYGYVVTSVRVYWKSTESGLTPMQILKIPTVFKRSLNLLIPVRASFFLHIFPWDRPAVSMHLHFSQRYTSRRACILRNLSRCFLRSSLSHIAPLADQVSAVEWALGMALQQVHCRVILKLSYQLCTWRQSKKDLVSQSFHLRVEHS